MYSGAALGYDCHSHLQDPEAEFDTATELETKAETEVTPTADATVKAAKKAVLPGQ